MTSALLNVVFYDLLPLYLVVKALSTRVSVLPLTPEWGLFSVLLFG
jgi:hypothetical protein